MRTIWKYELPIPDQVIIKMPFGSKPLSVGVQDGKLMVWCEVDTNRKDVEFKFYIQGTGNPIPFENAEYIGTVQILSFVWHIYYTWRY